jgi:predicted metal-dependent phosphoesterase TrpH
MTAPRVCRYDLHSHSTCSDGTMRPRDLVARAAQRGVGVLALTDHDELSGLAEARAAAVDAGIALIDGVEVSVTWNDRTIHVVGLLVDPGKSALAEGLLATRDGRNARAERMAAALDRIGIPGTLEGARRHVTNPDLVSRTHFARHLVESGRARSTQAVFENYLGEGKPGFVPHAWVDLVDAVSWIDAAGGMAVIAHPGRYKLDERQRARLLGEFKDCGGVGIEVVTGSHTSDQYGYWAARAREFGFLASCGSDFHGPRESNRDLGDLPALPSGCTPIWSEFQRLR